MGFCFQVSSIEEPPEAFDGKIDINQFWDRVSMEMIARVLVRSDQINPLIVPLSYHFWAPWIGPYTRSGNLVLNTEHMKIHAPVTAKEEVELTVTEDRLTDELLKLQMDAVRALCRQCGVDPMGSRLDLITRLRAEMKNRSTYDQIFQKVWGASVKFNVRAESPWDFADLLMSMKHFPNVTLYDFARGLATHANIREPGTFRTHEGRLLEPTLGNVALATSGQMEVDLPWLHQKKEDPDLNGHPLTGSADRYALYDRFHEGNTKDPKEVLRKIDLVPQLSGWLNSQCDEQLFSGMRKNNYFLNMMTPSSHIFLVRNILHHQNNSRNVATVDIKKRLGGGVDIKLNRFGQTVLAESTGTEDTTRIDDPDPATTTIDDPDPATTAIDDPDPATTTIDDPDPATTAIDDPDPATTTIDDPDPATTAIDEPDPATTANQDTDTMC
ncbi:hypothetical protein ACEWY4_012709 [Coilia grayii]|uniref:SAP domain-containing protein n=1 Tax=Coilia grayii TaxID=363190 RepID=A0ABD1K1H0_9TELE